MKKAKKIILLTVFLLCAGVLIFFLKYSFKRENVMEFYSLSANVSQSFSEGMASTEKKTTTLIFVGDIMLDRGVEYMMKKNNNWRWPFLKIADELKKADILFGNLEGPISDKGTKVGSIYSFRSAPTTTEALMYAGFDILSLANNHALDYGSEALKDTLSKLKNANIIHVGAGLNENEAFSPIEKEIDGTNIAFLAYTNLGSQYWRAATGTPGIAWISEKDFEKIKKDIQDAKTRADIIIVSIHAGTEYSQTITEFQKDFSKMAIDAGADIIIGHHPHVVQTNEKYKNGWIFYSLGNFVFDQSFSEETMKGQIVKVLVENKKIKEVLPVKIKINQYYQPYIEINEIQVDLKR